MRIWSIHPKYLDAKGIVALWRETLLAKHVLEGKTKGYLHHPQLIRFKVSSKPLDAINQYLTTVYDESQNRGYHFESTKFSPVETPLKLTVTQGQLSYEFNHLLSKLRTRDLKLYEELKTRKAIEPHPIFEVVAGEIEEWEIVS